jgi:hypothetical protein
LAIQTEQVEMLGMDDEMVSVIDIANELGKRKQSIFKVLNRLNIERNFEKSEASRGQRIAYITLEDYRRVKAYYVDASSNAEVPITLVDSDTGALFYLIQLEPRYDPGRFKLGFATNIEERLRSHRTSAPFQNYSRLGPANYYGKKLLLNVPRKPARGFIQRSSGLNQSVRSCLGLISFSR